jgi:hypothetical protein
LRKKLGNSSFLFLRKFVKNIASEKVLGFFFRFGVGSGAVFGTFFENQPIWWGGLIKENDRKSWSVECYENQPDT